MRKKILLVIGIVGTIMLSGCGASKKDSAVILSVMNGLARLEETAPDYGITSQTLDDDTYESVNVYNNYRNQIYVSKKDGDSEYLNAAEGLLYKKLNGEEVAKEEAYWKDLPINYDNKSKEYLKKVAEGVRAHKWKRVENDSSADGSTITMTLIFHDMDKALKTYEQKGIEALLDKGETADENASLLLAASFALSDSLTDMYSFGGVFLESDGSVTSVKWNDVSSVAESYRWKLWENGENAPSVSDMTSAVIEEMKAKGISYATSCAENDNRRDGENIEPIPDDVENPEPEHLSNAATAENITSIAEVISDAGTAMESSEG